MSKQEKGGKMIPPSASFVSISKIYLHPPIFSLFLIRSSNPAAQPPSPFSPNFEVLCFAFELLKIFPLHGCCASLHRYPILIRVVFMHICVGPIMERIVETEGNRVLYSVPRLVAAAISGALTGLFALGIFLPLLQQLCLKFSIPSFELEG